MVNQNQLPLDQPSIRQKIEDYLLINRPRLHRQKKKCGQLRPYLDLLVKESSKEAQNLIQRGMIEKEAWNFAINQAVNRAESNNFRSFY
ncbi:MAG: hypothetical protein WAU62_04545 [Dehalococcoidales bacterium]